MGAAVVNSGPAFAEDAPQGLKSFAHAELVNLGSNQTIIKAVRMENGKNKSLAQIKTLDQEWMSTPGVDGFMKSLMNNACTAYVIQVSVPVREGSEVIGTVTFGIDLDAFEAAR